MNKITTAGFLCGCDTEYFNQLGKSLYASIREHAPWAHMHFHIFDATPSDIDWVNNREQCSVSQEATPEQYNQTIEARKAYWSNMRWVKVLEYYDDNTPVINIDADCVMVKPLSQEQFLQDLQRSWVPTAPKRDQRSLASAVGFAPDHARYRFAELLLDIKNNGRFQWADDQRMLDVMIDANEIDLMDLRYTDYKFRDNSYIWTGKGERKNGEKKGHKFIEASKKYQ
jgi:hypothetical protein